MLGLLESEKNVDKSPGQGHGGQRGKLSSSNRDRGETYRKVTFEQRLEGLFKFGTWNTKFAKHFFIEMGFNLRHGEENMNSFMKNSPQRKGCYFFINLFIHSLYVPIIAFPSSSPTFTSPSPHYPLPFSSEKGTPPLGTTLPWDIQSQQL